MHPFEQLSIPDGAVGIHWLGQDSFAIQDPAGTIVQIDPFFPHHRPPERYLHSEPPLDEAELKTDYVLVTHDHGDHTCIESLQRIHHAHPQAHFLGPVESIRRMAEAGIPQGLLSVLEAGDSADLGTMTVHALWSKPPGGAPEDDIAPPDVQHLGYVIQAGEVRVYVSGDLINTFADHDELMQPVAALGPDIGLLTMHPTEGEFPYFEGARKMAVELGFEAVVPAHYECFTQRTYDPYTWAALLPEAGPRPIVIPYNTHVMYMPA